MDEVENNAEVVDDSRKSGRINKKSRDLNFRALSTAKVEHLSTPISAPCSKVDLSEKPGEEADSEKPERGKR
jgi:hypothetical protein